jgi:hypothetical protein
VSTYKAWIKVPVDANADAKQTIIRQGLEETAARLIDELGVAPDDVREWFEEIGSNAADGLLT